ncbi:unnamed protein product [Pylaiella littoralis]
MTEHLQAIGKTTRNGGRRPLIQALASAGVVLLVVAVGFMPETTSWEQADTSLFPATTASPKTAAANEGGAAPGDVVTQAFPGASEGDGAEAESDGWRSLSNRELASSDTSGSVSTTKPNVFFFLIDDMGYGDIGYQSTDLSDITPNMDALAAGGIKLSNYYSQPICTPARGSFMTGRYPVRLGMQYAIIFAGAPWGLPSEEKLLPEYMNDAGYESHMVGKWHLGNYDDSMLSQERGFKTSLGFLSGAESFYSHEVPGVSLDGKSFVDFGYGDATGYYDVHSCDSNDATGSMEGTPPTPATTGRTPRTCISTGRHRLSNRKRRMTMSLYFSTLPTNQFTFPTAPPLPMDLQQRNRSYWTP